MKATVCTFLLLILCSCVYVGGAKHLGNVEYARLVIKEPGHTAGVHSLTSRHQFQLLEDRTLLYNGEAVMQVPEGKQVLVELADGQHPFYRIEDID